MAKKERKLDTNALNLVAILGNSDKSASINGLSERGAKGFLGSRATNTSNGSKRRYFRKEAGYISR